MQTTAFTAVVVSIIIISMMVLVTANIIIFNLSPLPVADARRRPGLPEYDLSGSWKHVYRDSVPAGKNDVETPPQRSIVESVV